MSYLLIKCIPKKVDCCHLVAKFYRNEFGIDTSSWDAITRDYDLAKEHEHMFDSFNNTGWEEIDMNTPCEKGDVILYKTNNGRCGAAVCLDNIQAIVMERVSKLIHIDRIENKKNHFRYKLFLNK